MKYRVVFLTALVAFAITLAVVVGQRMSAEAMAVIVGVVAGVAASIPTSLIVVWVASRSAVAGRPTPASAESQAPPPQPRLVVLQPHGPAAPSLPGPAYGYHYAQPAPHAPYAAPYVGAAYGPAPRSFTVIGEEVLEGLQPAWMLDGAGPGV